MLSKPFVDPVRHSALQRGVFQRRRLAALGTFIIASMAWQGLSSAATPTVRRAAHPAESRVARRCFHDATTPPQPLPMPNAGRLLNAISLKWNGSIVLAPAPSSAVGNVVSPSSIWRTAPLPAVGSHSQLFLAYFSASVPATLTPDGSLVPFSAHVLAWVLLTQHLPFDTAAITHPAGETVPVTCTFVGQGITAWNAVSGAELAGGGFHAPSQPSVIRPDVAPWAQAGIVTTTQ
jgi:hypothetical protein